MPTASFQTIEVYRFSPGDLAVPDLPIFPETPRAVAEAKTLARLRRYSQAPNTPPLRQALRARLLDRDGAILAQFEYTLSGSCKATQLPGGAVERHQLLPKSAGLREFSGLSAEPLAAAFWQ